MLFVAMCHDKPGRIGVRLTTRDAHLAWLKSLGATVRLGGPFLDGAGVEMQGSILVVDAADLAAAEAIFAADPYAAAGLFQSVEIRPWRWVVGAPSV